MVNDPILAEGWQMRDVQQGSGRVEHGQVLRLHRPTTTPHQYSNAQIDDYGQVGLRHTPPLRMQIRASFSHPLDDLRGTAGFGFWNAPLAPDRLRFRIPKAVWFFFGSPPLNLPLALDVPGQGFKAATLDAATWQFAALLPAAPLGFALMRVPSLYRRLWPIGQRAIKVSEATLQLDITQPHDYRLDWLPHEVEFYVDGHLEHISPYSPTGPLGFIAWLDNQYAVVTPQGQFGWGLVEASAPQWLDVHSLDIASLA